MTTQEEKQKYAQQFMETLEKSPGKLTKYEQRLGRKLQESQSMVKKQAQDVNQMRDQIEQGKARLRSLELQLENAAGRASGVLETIVELHFDDEGGKEPGKSDTPKPEKVTKKTRKSSKSKKPAANAA